MSRVQVRLCAFALLSCASLAWAADPPPVEPAPPSTAPAAAPSPPEELPPAAPPAQPQPGTSPPAPGSPWPASAPPLAPPPAALVPRSAPRQARVEGGAAPEADAGVAREPAEPARHRFALSLGLRTLFVVGEGYEPFAEEGVLWGAALGAGVRVYDDGPLSLLVGAVWDIAHSESEARRADTALDVHRVTAVPELRYALTRRLVGYGRVGVGAGYARATYQDAVIAAERADDAVSFTADAGVGLALRVGGRDPTGARAAFWLSLEGGYLWTSDADLALTSEQDPARAEPMGLEALSVQGPYTKLSVILGF